MHTVLQILTLLGALAMFLYGMTMMSEGLQKAAGDKLRSLLASMTSNPFKRVFTGFLVTAIIQSSSATTVMVVSFVNAGILSLTNAIGVIMGANIGTTVTAWIVSLLGFSFDISSLSIPLMLVGFIFMMSKKNRYKNIGQLIIGFALLFLGLSTMKGSVPNLSEHPEVLAFLQKWTGYGFGTTLIFLLIGTCLTIILQSSSATMALTLVMVNFGWIPFEAAAAMVLGENIGTTITANIAAAVGNVSAKRTALAHTLFNVIGVIWMLILFKPFLKLVGLIVGCLGVPNPMTVDFADIAATGATTDALSKSSLYGVSMLHTMFNLCNTLLLIWFTKWIEKAVTLIIKPKKDEDELYRLKYIQGGLLATPELSLNEATHEIEDFGKICYKQFGYLRQAVVEKDPEKFSYFNAKLAKYEEITDRIEFEIASYINEVSKGELSDVAVDRIKSLYRIISEMESLGDYCEAIGRILQRKNAHGKEFDDDMFA
ncbi:MAG: Na/Pi cotransporter family protein, partial [Bacteroidales bacterium]|nr:Na/Pi cotransporter family protein [Bacteroidales bacterium]